jgi:hypothetical protein
MGLFNHKKSNGLVTINILHRRLKYPKGTTFMNCYKVKHDSERDLKTIFYEAFTKAHPGWSILEIRLQNDD